MTPLKQLLADRAIPTSSWGGLHRLTANTFPPLGHLIERRIWPDGWRHMRSIVPGYLFEQTGEGGWRMKDRGNLVAECLPLREIAKIDKPVTIFATGPSSLDCDWQRLKERFVIAVNGATGVLKKRGIRPDLHVVIDRQFALSGVSHFTDSPDVPLVTTHRAGSVIASLLPGYFAKKPIALIERVNSWYGQPRLADKELRELNERSGSPFHFPDQPDKKCSIGWSDAPQLGVFSGFTVVMSALQVAIYLGAKDIEIIGMDLSAAGRAYDEGDNAQPSGLVNDYAKYILPTFEMMHRALDGRDVEIRNLSPVCPLPAHLFTRQ